jgi:protein required for attachment to host cells
MLITWLLVANRAAARVLLHRPGQSPQLLLALEHPQARAHNRAFDADRAGNVYKPAEAAFHAMSQERDSRRHETEVFARQIMAHLNVAHARGEFDRLVIAAEPALLGVLRACLEPRTAAATIDIARNLSHLPDRALEAELPDAFRVRGASARPPQRRTS